MSVPEPQDLKMPLQHDSARKLHPQAWKIMGVVMLAPFMTQIDSTVVNVSLSAIEQDLHSTISTAQWIISGYLLALALVLPLNAWLVDRFGAKKLYLFCFSSFTLASFLCGAAQSMPQLISARIVQGLAGGLLVPLTQFMLAQIAGRHMARVVGYALAPALLAPLFGPALAGALLKYASWPWLFYINVPVGIFAVALAALVIPPDLTVLTRRPFDFVGFFLLSPGLSCLLYGFVQTAHQDSRRTGVWFLMGGACLLGAFLKRALKKKAAALIDTDLFKIRTFFVAAATQFLMNGIMFCAQFLIPLYFISGVGLSASNAGWILSTMGIGMLCVYPLMGRLTDRFGCRLVACTGVFINLLGSLVFLGMAHFRYWQSLALVALLFRGIGQGAAGIPAIAAAYAAVPKIKLSFAATSLNIIQRLGGPMLTTTLALVVSFSVHPSDLITRATQFQIPFLVLIFFQLLALGSASQLPKEIIHFDT